MSHGGSLEIIWPGDCFVEGEVTILKKENNTKHKSPPHTYFFKVTAVQSNYFPSTKLRLDSDWKSPLDWIKS